MSHESGHVIIQSLTAIKDQFTGPNKKSAWTGVGIGIVIGLATRLFF